ncbi:hypothetical protein [Bartonella sp. AA9NXGY]|uniref:hypothetical protein n=1 Tax=Bartonella sp. AA9NXGY TaxID=3243443 RepID=UPI0035CF4250
MHPNTPGLQHAPPPQAYPPRPSFTPFLLSTFLLFPRRHFPCSWQADINRAASKTFNEKQTLWHSPSHTGTPTHAPPPQQDTPTCTTPSQTYPPHLLSTPSSFPPSSFSQGATSHALGKQTLTQPFQKGLSESQAHWQAKKFRDYWQKKSGKEALK